MEASKYQQEIIDWALNGKGHGCCGAVAGSGKSTTLLMVAKALEGSGIAPKDIKIIVFGKANSIDLKEKFGRGWEKSISTLHSTGFRVLCKHLKVRGGAQVSSTKYEMIAAGLGLIGRPYSNSSGILVKEKIIDGEYDFKELLHLMRLTNQEVTPESVKATCEHFGLDEINYYPTTSEAINKVLELGEEQAASEYLFDYTDQIWLPIKWNLHKQRCFSKYKWVFVDEAQDLNAVQQELSIALAGKRGRVLTVGDERQSIMAFSGSDCNSYRTMMTRLKAKELPLSICYRCPSSAIELVRANFPEIPIEARDNAPAGVVRVINWQTLFSNKPEALLEGDMVLCRKNAPLISLCLDLITQGIPAKVKGRAIGEMIKGDLKAISKIKGFTFEEFYGYLELYTKTKKAKYIKCPNAEELIEKLYDRVNALEAIYDGLPNAKGVGDMYKFIDDLFTDDRSPITLSSCHRAKGLEADRVYIIEPHELGGNKNGDWKQVQEDNLLYVALTRTKSELYIVGEASWTESLTDLGLKAPLGKVKSKLEELLKVSAIVE